MERTVRRLAAVLASDVVGYSGKIEADESSTLAALKDVRATTIDPFLAENSGRTVAIGACRLASKRGSAPRPRGSAVAPSCFAGLGKSGARMPSGSADGLAP